MSQTFSRRKISSNPTQLKHQAGEKPSESQTNATQTNVQRVKKANQTKSAPQPW
jgi:hypothetical protein